MSDPLAQLDAWPVRTAAAAVISCDGVVAARGGTARPFALASVTKPLVALGVLVAVEEGALDLDDPVLPAVVPGATVRHLLSHASGLSPDRRNLAAAPGARRIYSNAGFEVLGEALSAGTGMPVADYLREAVFEPLGMTDSALAGSPARHAISTVGDLAALVSRLVAGPAGWLHPSTLADATAVQFPGLRGVVPGYGMQDPNDWGLGFEIRAHKAPHWTGAANSPATFGHFGQAGTMLWVDPAAGLGLVALTDEPFGGWAAEAWPRLSDAVVDRFGGSSPMTPS
jgi:CubicO group peptidase (beta-lactamase class C family)